MILGILSLVLTFVVVGDAARDMARHPNHYTTTLSGER